MSRLVRIVGSYVSPYVRKVLVVLDLKGIPYDIDPIERSLVRQSLCGARHDRHAMAARHQAEADLARPGLRSTQLRSEARGAEEQAGPRRSLVLTSVHGPSLDE